MRTILALLLASFAFTSQAQKLKLKSYALAYKVFEIDAVGNNPLTIAPYLKKPGAYQNFINQMSYNGLYGNPGIQLQRNFYFNTEWQKDSTESRFWRKYRLETGLFITARIRRDNMGLENQQVVITANDTTLYRDLYSLVLKEQFAGLNLGISRKAHLSNWLSFVTGVHCQLNFAFAHYYHQQLDSGVYRNQVWTTKTSQLPNLKGKNFLQWQVMVPISFEVNAYSHKVFVRPELDLGIINDRYRKMEPSLRVANGYGISLIYQPKG